MRRSKKLQRKLASRIKDYENTVARSTTDAKAYRRPGSVKKG